MRASFIAPIDQSIRELEMMALEKLYIDIVENHGVDDIILTYHEIGLALSKIHEKLKSRYPKVRLTQKSGLITQEEISAETDLYIFAYLCNDRCFRWQTCDREFVMKEKENARCCDKPRVRLMDYYNSTVLTEPYLVTNP